ncbi:30S ribosomal protein S4 [Candidatus Woesearchaeota archaeon]|nr:30S ribosomal protein S4 [Candidatus Woesearchaeota archaeon]
MGHPKLKKKTYSKPTHPWQKDRIEEEKSLLGEFGLKNKSEVWKADSLLRKYARQAKNLIALGGSQSEIRRMQLLRKLASFGLIGETAKLEDVLTITVKDMLSRRLQTITCKKGLAKSIRQARQLITHEHIIVGDKKITSPSYIVSKKEEALIGFAAGSPLSSQDHPERISGQQKPVKADSKGGEKPKKETKEEPKKEKKEDTKKKEEGKQKEKEKGKDKQEPKKEEKGQEDKK